MISIKTIAVSSFSGLAVLGFVGLGFAGSGASQNTEISPDILIITPSVYALSGKIEKIEGNNFKFQAKIVQRTRGLRMLRTPDQPGPRTQDPVMLDYEFLVSSNTAIRRDFAPVPYLVRKSTGTQAPPANYDKPREGDIAQVTSEVDLRLIAQRKFVARNIQLFSIPNSVRGNVVNIKGNTIFLHGAIFSNSPGSTQMEPDKEIKDYEVTVTKETEISRMDSSPASIQPAQIKSFKMSELKKDMALTVYTDADVSSSVRFKALRIEPGTQMSVPQQTMPLGMTGKNMPAPNDNGRPRSRSPRSERK